MISPAFSWDPKIHGHVHITQPVLILSDTNRNLRCNLSFFHLRLGHIHITGANCLLLTLYYKQNEPEKVDASIII
jgi:hypothetical protein